MLANGSVRIKVKITVKADKQIPEYKVPTDLKGIYGQTLADVTIPETERQEVIHLRQYIFRKMKMSMRQYRMLQLL